MSPRISFALIFFVWRCVCAAAGEASALPEFDFTHSRAAAGWTTQHDLAAPETSADGLVLKITGSDPYLHGPEMVLPSGEELWLRVRLRSEQGGVGRIFFSAEAASAKNSLYFETPAGRWSEQLLALPKLGPKCRLRFDPPGEKGSCVIALLRLEHAGAAGVVRVRATADTLALDVCALTEALEIAELSPHESYEAAAQATLVGRVSAGKAETLRVPRFEGARDRLYSGFIARDVHGAVGAICFVEEMQGIAKNTAPMPPASSKKGIQAQMVDDALALGIKHAALNVSLSALVQVKPDPDSLSWKMDGDTYYFRRKTVEAIPVKQYSDAGVHVSLILLNYLTSDPPIDRVMRPARAGNAPNHIFGFNVETADGVRYLKACAEFLADRFSSADGPNGRVAGYIVGNEVNSHGYWYNLGSAPMPLVAEEYLRAVRMIHTAVRKSSSTAAVYISLDHHWTATADKDPQHTCGGKFLVDYLNRLSKLGGDFDWSIAHHPYPENLFEPRVWLDKAPTAAFDTPKITFKNLEQLPAYLRQPEMLCHGATRRIILSEQGFHTPDGPEGQAQQAAGFCYAYYKVAHLEGIDAFILHRHVDHEKEGGARFGLWTCRPGSIYMPDAKKKIYDVFRLADTAEWETAFEFALPMIGIQKWAEILPAK